MTTDPAVLSKNQRYCYRLFIAVELALIVATVFTFRLPIPLKNSPD